MNIIEKLEVLKHYYVCTRNVGHTALMKEGTKHYEREKFILGYKKKFYNELECKSSELISWNNLNALYGAKKPLVIDNSVMCILLDESLQKMNKLEEENKNLKIKLTKIKEIL
jgi:hypothetical protein